MNALISSLSIVLIAEMADKTQLMTMCFASQYPWKTVAIAVFAAISVSNLLAVAAGGTLASVIPFFYIKIAASLLFILFGILSLKAENFACENKSSNYSPFWTISGTFFLAELGDKTQLATLALAAKHNYYILTWLGATLGMVLANIIGIVTGTIMGKGIPDKALRYIAATVFISFGLAGLYSAWN